MNVNQCWRRFASAFTVLGLACAGLVAGVVPAFAAPPITTQPYTTLLGIDQLHAQGLDGAGVKIALIDGPVDTTVPELQGVTVIKKAFCPITYAPHSIAHATEIASILASPYYGWAPKATILNYASPTTDDLPDGETINSAWPDCGRTDTRAYQIEQALNDGADVISISQAGASPGFDMTFALVRAALKGVPVVMGVGNDSSPTIAGTASPNTVVAVGAVDASGQRASYSNWGAGLTIMAYGGPVSARYPDTSGALSVINTATVGTSFSTPMVAGALALAKQKWPGANGNQLERVMFDTIDGVADHASAQPSPDMGFGVLNAPLMVATDPSGYSSDNVLAQKSPGEHPTPDDFTAYQNGTANPITLGADNDYVYRGCDPSILKYGIPSGMKVEASTAPECQ
ncbi:MAG: S8 family serine peptidase, partial [Propionibacteriaceae bacterium]|nr:S8 family serine peptidase [Propionibacteriaceae bacterium]